MLAHEAKGYFGAVTWSNFAKSNHVLVCRLPKVGQMTRRITVTITEEQALRLTVLADAYNCGAIELARDLLLEAIRFCESAIECEACEQIAWLAQVEPEGRA